MEKVRLGRTGICVNRNGFGALPIQRVAKGEAVQILGRACAGGVELFDTARAYSDSEEKLGAALGGVREKVVLATKTMARTPEGFWKDLEASLLALGTTRVDIYQFHNPPFCPRPGDGSGLYEAMLEARAQGKIRFIGLTNHSLALAREAVESGLYDTLQFPFSYLADEREEALVRLCAREGVGFLCMKALAGGLITRADAAFAYMGQFDNALPIWGIQREEELDEFLAFQADPPVLTGEIQSFIREERSKLAGEFCRGCGYCMPCPAGIEINTCARMSLMLRRSPTQRHLSPQGQAMMARVRECSNCGRCKARCPYKLDVPALLKKNYAEYGIFLARERGQ